MAMNARTIRTALVVCDFLATAVVFTVGAAGRGETNEIPVNEPCRAAAWPMIPAACLDSGAGQEVRMVSMVADASQLTGVLRAPVEAPVAAMASGKGDLLQRLESSVVYLTVEIRRDGVSELSRVRIERHNEMR
jgi:hypothetical protein